MLEYLMNYKGSVNVNGFEFESVKLANKSLTEQGYEGTVTVKITGTTKQSTYTKPTTVTTYQNNKVYKITVKKYMTKPSSADFDFQTKWNKDTPMPLRIMVGKIIKETKGMYQMELHGEILGDGDIRCMSCGRALTNKVSQYFQIGPECGSHGYVNPFETEKELADAVSSYNEKLKLETRWTGWVIKSAITEMEEI